ncbi:MAG: sugar-transfer associated ATP-grasp domain-containing protein [Parcubacteria group bacterium]
MMGKIKEIFTSVPLGMNLRNYAIQVFNPRESMLLAKDKLATKKLLVENDIPTPATYSILEKHSDLKLIARFPSEVVLKPNHGHGGNGILVLERKSGGYFDPAGESHSIRNIEKHILKILDGEFSGFMEKDTAIVEERLYPSSKIIFKYAAGLPDIRIFCINHIPVMAMLRYATKETNGRANLSMGAIGIAIDVGTGVFTHLHKKKEGADITLDDLGIPAGFIMPKWKEMKDVAIKASRFSGLSVAGIDLILDRKDRVMVLEINGRPGIEIQNINEKSLLNMFEQLDVESEKKK